MTVCPNCGSNSEDDSIFCEECGYQIKSKSSEISNSPSKINSPPSDKKIRFIKQKK